MFLIFVITCSFPSFADDSGWMVFKKSIGISGADLGWIWSNSN